MLSTIAHEITPSGEWRELSAPETAFAQLAVQCWPERVDCRAAGLQARAYALPVELVAGVACALVTLATTLLQIGGIL